MYLACMHAPMTPAPEKQPADSQDQSSGEGRQVKAIFVVYAVFFLLWCIGLVIGFMDDAPMLFGMPFWFLFSCVFSYVLICFILIRAVRRYF